MLVAYVDLDPISKTVNLSGLLDQTMISVAVVVIAFAFGVSGRVMPLIISGATSK